MAVVYFNVLGKFKQHFLYFLNFSKSFYWRCCLQFAISRTQVLAAVVFVECSQWCLWFWIRFHAATTVYKLQVEIRSAFTVESVYVQSV